MTLFLLLIDALSKPRNIAPVLFNVCSNNTHVLVVLLLEKDLCVYFVFELCQLFWPNESFLFKCTAHLYLCDTLYHIAAYMLMLFSDGVHYSVYSLLLDGLAFSLEPSSITVCFSMLVIQVLELGHHVDDLIEVIRLLLDPCQRVRNSSDRP